VDPIHRDRAWIVMVVARPRNDGAPLRALLRHLRERAARRLTAGVFLVRDVEGAHECLVALTERVSQAGGRVVLADSVVVADRARGDDDGS
jgi:hypothetical protein